MTGYSFACGIEIICREGHRSKTAVTSGPVVHHVVIADDDITRRKIHSAVLDRWLFSGEKAYDSATGFNFAGVDLRQFFVEALHPELIQVDLRQLGAEFSSRRGKKLNICGPNSCLIGKWICKAENFAPGHSCSPGLPEAEKIALSRRRRNCNERSIYLYVADGQQWFKSRVLHERVPSKSTQNRHASDFNANSVSVTFENIFGETPAERLNVQHFSSEKDDLVCRIANVRIGSN